MANRLMTRSLLMSC